MMTDRQILDLIAELRAELLARHVKHQREILEKLNAMLEDFKKWRNEQQ